LSFTDSLIMWPLRIIGCLYGLWLTEPWPVPSPVDAGMPDIVALICGVVPQILANDPVLDTGHDQRLDLAWKPRSPVGAVEVFGRPVHSRRVVRHMAEQLCDLRKSRRRLCVPRRGRDAQSCHRRHSRVRRVGCEGFVIARQGIVLHICSKAGIHAAFGAVDMRTIPAACFAMLGTDRMYSPPVK
jgi:hypothetical protein